MEKIKVGIFGCNRGTSLMKNIVINGGEIVAICDKEAKWRENAIKALDGKAPEGVYESFDEFIEHPGLQAVVLANYFHEHAPYAIRCLERGIHVMTECTSNGTMAEGVALVRAAEKSDAIYMLAENYPYMQFNQEMHRVYQGGSLGKVLFAEGEYNHPGPGNSEDTCFVLKPFAKHWRNFLPGTYYITHSLAPLMYITGATPKRVTAFPMYNPAKDDPTKYQSSFVSDNSAIVTILNDDNSVFRVTGCASFGAHGNTYRICGTKGQIENIRGSGGKVMLRYNEWQVPEGMEATNYYMPEWPEDKKELIEKAGHGGGDFFTAYEFLRCIREGKKHQFDVYFATTMASVAILSHRSVLENGMPYDIPDFRKEEDRVKYENDYATPFYGSDGSEPNIPCASRPGYRPPEGGHKHYLDLIQDTDPDYKF